MKSCDLNPAELINVNGEKVEIQGDGSDDGLDKEAFNFEEDQFNILDQLDNKLQILEQDNIDLNQQNLQAEREL